MNLDHHICLFETWPRQDVGLVHGSILIYGREEFIPPIAKFSTSKHRSILNFFHHARCCSHYPTQRATPTIPISNMVAPNSCFRCLAVGLEICQYSSSNRSFFSYLLSIHRLANSDFLNNKFYLPRLVQRLQCPLIYILFALTWIRHLYSSSDSIASPFHTHIFLIPFAKAVFQLTIWKPCFLKLWEVWRTQILCTVDW